MMVVGCAGSGALEVAPGVPFSLEVGDSAVLEGVEVSFAEVVEDSRCPDGAQCVWAGKARVRVTVDGTDAVLSVPNSPADGPEPSTTIVGTLEVAVQGLTPYPSLEPSSDPLEVVLVVEMAE